MTSVLELTKQNRSVVVLDNLSAGHREAVSGVSFYEGDIGDAALVKAIIKHHDVDAVIHFAAKSLVSESIEKPEIYFRENTLKSCAFFKTVIKEGVLFVDLLPLTWRPLTGYMKTD
ncbi:UDP-glucose 4-epimerase [Bacillus paralicheniformis]|nr:UDP-glucose 4-epimerase [Bacillus paralicheniformis]